MPDSGGASECRYVPGPGSTATSCRHTGIHSIFFAEADKLLDGVSLYVNFLLCPVFSVTFAADGETRVILLTPLVTADTGTAETGIKVAATANDSAADAIIFISFFSSFTSLATMQIK